MLEEETISLEWKKYGIKEKLTQIVTNFILNVVHIIENGISFVIRAYYAKVSSYFFY